MFIVTFLVDLDISLNQTQHCEGLCHLFIMVFSLHHDYPSQTSYLSGAVLGIGLWTIYVLFWACLYLQAIKRRRGEEKQEISNRELWGYGAACVSGLHA